VGIPAERGDPLGQMKISARAKAHGVHRDSTALLTACGLALRSFD
jgi:type IV pilus assembly protein PilM